MMIFSLIHLAVTCPLVPLFRKGFQLVFPLTNGFKWGFFVGPSVLEALLDRVDPLVTELAGELDKSPD